ncbi:hypothetical protein [Clostridium oryzae]|uniref:hypothetical protein n=1 Tax=Clostridium oryzae TaxID=1450648 RepID=UPI0014742A8C|nr:hypothetical protein [Clostridium oryzae]
MISLRQRHKRILIDETRSQIASKSDLFCYAREAVLEKLISKKKLFPVFSMGSGP